MAVAVDELEPFFAHYAERYTASDADAISAVYEAPLLALREGTVIHLADAGGRRQILSDTNHDD